ncbi:DUF3833 family protein [Cognatishimia sp. SS12]|uniref:DUF3833 family protein n=1 Tax=Cognatishimia sp. SS12 TaxID=2979465 RepID=UPI00232CC8F1|nr:DUF3833 family protein [Cognatishimia sp. SS12]MDC0739438.1 DUF3833 family protein [Cognatishimia sp. SS12]
MLNCLTNRLPSFGFTNQRSADYADTGPNLQLREHLSGNLISEGVIFGPRGTVVSRFVADMQGTWDGSRGTLNEAFAFSSGDTQTRRWELSTGNDGRFWGTAADIVGKMTGETSGATARMDYRLRLEADAGGHVLSVTDWMYLTENGTILNRSHMRKFGVKVAELVATIRRAPG